MPNDVIFFVCVPTANYEYNFKKSSKFIANQKLLCEKRNIKSKVSYEDNQFESLSFRNPNDPFKSYGNNLEPSEHLFDSSNEKNLDINDDQVNQKSFISMEIVS